MRKSLFVLFLFLSHFALAEVASDTATQTVRDDPFANLKTFMAKSRKIYLVQNAITMNTNTYQQQVNFSSVKTETDIRSESKMGFTFQTGYSQSLYDRQDGTRERSMDYLVSPSYQMSQNYRLGILVSGSSDLNGTAGSDFGRGEISLSHKPYEFISIENKLKSWSLTPAVAIALPVSKPARDDESFLAGIKPRVTISPSSEMLGSRRWDVSLSVSLARYFHTYDIAKNGSSNTQYGSSQSLILGYALPKNLRLELSAGHFNAWTYQGTASESYNHTEELSYKISNSWSIAGGHTFGNPAVNIYGADGQSFDAGIISEKYSYVYNNVTYTY